MSRKRSRRRSRLPQDPVEVVITGLTAEGRGIAHVDGQVVFVDQALDGEKVVFKYTTKTAKFAEGVVVEVLTASPDRVEPVCDAYDRCGGCRLQHMAHSAQIRLKQAMLLDQLTHIGKAAPETVLPPLTGPTTGYRYKARLGVRRVLKKNRTLVGFRERNGRYLADMSRCEVLHPAVGEKLASLAGCIDQLETAQSIPQIEVAIGDEQTALIIRHLEPLPETDRERLREYCRQNGFSAWLQAGKPDQLEALWPVSIPVLFYDLPDFGIRIEFEPADFTQVNPAINRKMVALAIGKMALERDDRVLDLFSGLGNFSLAMATRSGHVTAVEGALEMVHKARHNARINGLDNIDFHYADLYSDDVGDAPWIRQQYDKVLLDPPRSGAAAMMPFLAKMQAETIVYVSCHPGTLARDTAVLTGEMGYRLEEAGIMDMFPHTAHVESIAVFRRKKTRR